MASNRTTKDMKVPKLHREITMVAKAKCHMKPSWRNEHVTDFSTRIKTLFD
jgi:hypothetical protein